MTNQQSVQGGSVQWLVQIGYRNHAGQHEIVKGIGDSKEEAVALAEENRMLPIADEIVRCYASRQLSPWQKEDPIYAEQEN